MKTLLLIPLLLAGCVTYPQTKVQFDPKTQTVSIESPKEIELKNLKATVHTDGTVEVSIESYASRNNAEVVKAVVEAQTKINADVTEKSKQLIEGAFKAGGL